MSIFLLSQSAHFAVWICTAVKRIGSLVQSIMPVDWGVLGAGVDEEAFGGLGVAA